MADVVNTGLAPNDNLGDRLRDGFRKVNTRFNELLATLEGGQPWAPLTAYTATPVRQWVVESGQAYLAISNHTSGAVFATDLAAGKWLSADVAQLILDLANPAMGPALLGYLAPGIGAVPETVAAQMPKRLRPESFGAVSGGVAPCADAFQKMFDAAAAHNVPEIFFPGNSNYLLECNTTDLAYTCSVVIRGLKNCKIYGGKGAKLTQSTDGSGATEYGFFRLEECENVTFTNFEMDGSGIVNDGAGANRSRGIVVGTYDVNNPTTDLAESSGIKVFNVTFRSMGGGVGTTLQNESLDYPTKIRGLSVQYCKFFDIKGQDHGVGVNFVDDLEIRKNRFVNTTPWSPVYGGAGTGPVNMAVDVSAGCHGAEVTGNYVYGYVFGMKSETHLLKGPGANETRESRRVLFENNILEEIGHATLTTWPGASGGLLFGIKANSDGAIVRGNTITPRTIGVTTGGLGVGILGQNTHDRAGKLVIEDNTIGQALYSILHNDTATSRASALCWTTIHDNRLHQPKIHGIVAQSNVKVTKNTIIESLSSAIKVQVPSQTYIHDNIAINCATDNNAVTGTRVVYEQEGTGTFGYMEWLDNKIFDTRGASAAHHGYLLRAYPASASATNKLMFRAGVSEGLLTAISWDYYLSAVGPSLQRNGTVLPAPRVFYVTNSPAITAPWNTLTFNLGDTAILQTPVVGQPKYWTYSTTGWVSAGNL
jgi:hypothetical protein